jgi:hypothetical protein
MTIAKIITGAVKTSKTRARTKSNLDFQNCGPVIDRSVVL